MSNPKFLPCDLSLPTYAWSAGTNASYPISNLKTYYPDQKSRSNATTDAQTLTITFGSAITPSLVVIEGQNFASLGATSVKLQYNDGTWNDACTFDIVNNNVQMKTITGATAASWRVLFTKGSALSAAPEIGNIFIGTSLDFEKTQQWGCVVQMPSHNVSTSEALDGRIRSAVTAGGRYNWEIEFKLQSDTFVTAWRTFLLTAKNNGTPFYYVDSNSAIWLVVFESNYNPTTMFRYNQNDTARFKIKTVLANY